MKKKMLLIGIYFLSICTDIFVTTESCLGQNTYLKARVNKNNYKEIYSYNYTIINNLASGDSIIEFSLDVSRIDNTKMLDTIGLSFANEYTENTVRRSYGTLYGIITSISFSNLPRGWNAGLYNDKTANWGNPRLLPPDSIVSGFTIESKGIPSIRWATVIPFLDVEQFPSMDDLNTLEEADSLMRYIDSIRDAGPKYTKTIGPTNPPSVFNSLIFLDTLKSYTTQSLSLGWIANQTTANKYLTYFDTAKVRIQRGENKSARNALNTVLQNVNQDSSGLLTSEAYALIRFNTEYLIENLPGVVTLPSSVSTGWNMISIPVDASSYIKSELYPQSTSNAFMYYAGYVRKDTLENGIGYWLKFGTNDTLKYKSFIIDVDTVDVNAGWNMIGSISSNIIRSKIKAENTEIVSPFFGFQNGYQVDTIIIPGKSYWVKVSQAGNIILDKYATAGAGQPPSETPPPPPGAPDIPELYSPNNGSTGISKTPTLIWFSSIKAQTYRLQVSTNSTFTNLVFDDSTLTTTSKQIGTLANSTTYYWRVNAKNEIWTSDWSTVFWFRTLGTPLPPDPCQPIDAFSALDQFTVSDMNGNKQQLFAHNGGRRLALGLRDYDMPPEPIEDVFHAKFQSGKFVESVPPGKGVSKIPIKIKNASFPITINWNIRPESNTKYWLYKSGRDKILLSGVGSTTINSLDGNLLLIEAQAILPDPCY